MISLLLFCVPLLVTAQSTTQHQNDSLILNTFSQILKKNKQGLVLDNSNNTVISLIQTLKDFELTKDNSKIDSVKIRYGIENINTTKEGNYSNIISYQDKKDSISNFNSIFNINEYNYLLNQRHQGVWDIDKLLNRKLLNKSTKASFSKPIYTRDGLWAFMRNSYPTRSSTLVLRKIDGNWEIYKHIEVYISSPKLKFTSTRN